MDLSDQQMGELPRLALINPVMPVKMAMGHDICYLQHKRNLTLGLPDLEASGEIQLARNYPIAIVGGGPSLKKTIDELRNFKGAIMACGSAHDYLIEQGIELNYCIVLDPDPASALYLKRDGGKCRYLIASHVAPQTLFALEGKNVYLFGAGGTFEKDEFNPLPIVMVGGRTVGTRGMGMALGLGFRDFHLFGFDSCLEDDHVHAYENDDDKVFDELIRQSTRNVYCNGRKFKCASYMIGQAMDFQKFMSQWDDTVSVTVHGDGLISEIMKAAEHETKIAQMFESGSFRLCPGGADLN